jgi:tetratricopeptide (TPR) repeat protein
MVRLDLAKVLDEAGRQDEARREYETILAQQADYAPALTGLGAMLAREGQLDRAAELLGRSLAIDPSQDTGRFNLAKVYEQQGLSDEALVEYRRLADSAQASPAVRSAARERIRAMAK